MAITVCGYIHKLLRPNTPDIGVEVAEMTVKQPLIARPDRKSQILYLIVDADLQRERAILTYTTGSDKGTVHAEARVIFGSRNDWLSQWQRDSYLIQGRINYLQEAERKGLASKIGRGLAYKLFAALVDYSHSYRGMEEVILQAETMEATSRVVFQTNDDDGTFVCSPYWIDSVAHISGFIVNGSDAVDSRNQVYISHGWESLRIAEPLQRTKTYRSYVRMQQSVKNVLVGNVYVFDSDKIIAVVYGLKFQCIPRTVLNTLLPPGGPPAMAPAPKSEIKQRAMTTDSSPLQSSMKTNTSVKLSKSPAVWSQVLDIIATELGIERDELADNVDLNQLGVDSLMSLAISGSIREKLVLDIPSSTFSDNSTIAKLKEFFSRFDSEHNSSSDSSVSKSEEETQYTGDTIATPVSVSTGRTTPSLGEDCDFGNILRTTISEQMGIEISELINASDLSSLGMDSLMALSILGSLREQTGLELPGDTFLVNASLQELEQSLNPVPKDGRNVSKIETASRKSQPVAPLVPERHATSVLLQGHPKTCQKQVWVVPDGSGSATSYVHIPPLSTDVAMWGLNSPFMKNADEYTCGVVGMAGYFIKEIKRRQPQGPYLLAGWSAGGVIAFEVVNQLIKSGDQVDHLILIDTPCPLIIEPLPSSLHRWFGSIGLLGDGGGDLSTIPSWVLPHFAASVTALSNYTAELIDPIKCPSVTIIWCEDGVCKYPTDPRPDPYPYGHAQFLLENRTDFGPYLWDTYLDLGKITCRQMPGNHFSMMRGEYVRPKSRLQFHSLISV